MAGNTALPQGIEIFKEGTHVDDAGVPRVFTRADIDAMAAGYDPALHDAPLTIGHPKTDEPRYGAVAQLQAVDGADGRRTLTMSGADVEPAFAEAVVNKRFPKRSTAFYPPQHPQNPKPGQWYVRHVGFLGAQPPAVRGLAELQRLPAFADAGAGLVAFSEPIPTEEDARMSKELQEQLAAAQATAAAAKAAQAAAETAAAEANARLDASAKAQRTARHAEHVAFAESMLQAGKLKKPEVPECVALLDLAADAAPVQFGEGTDAKPLAPVGLIKRLVERAGALVAFSERPGAAGNSEGSAAGKSDAEIDAAAQAYMRQHNCNYSEALTRVVSFTA